MSSTPAARETRSRLLRAVGVGAASALLSLVLVLILPVAMPGSGTLPLLLPAAVAGPGTTITFFGGEFEGDSFVWCLDRSGSMGWGGTLDLMRAEVAQAVTSLSDSQELGLVAYSTNTSVWSSTPLPATPANKAAAIAWLNGLVPGGWTCMLDACLQSLDILDQATGAARAMFVVGDGPPICSGQDTSAQVLADVTAANTQAYPIHTVLVGLDPSGALFFETLAFLNGGSFIFVNGPGGPPASFRRGDANGSGGVEIADAIRVLSAQFVAGAPPLPCLDAADFNDDGAVQAIPDAVYLLAFLFVSGSPPPPGPYPACGTDVTPDAIDCASYSGGCP